LITNSYTGVGPTVLVELNLNMVNATLTAVKGLKVGHAQDRTLRTGCTTVLFEPVATVACEARGGFPGTYDTPSVDIAKTFVEKHAVFLTGGDVFGLDSAIGVRRHLLEQGLASYGSAEKLPGIVGANIYDLGVANVRKADYVELGHASCVNASSNPVEEGSVGAGIGATVGKFRGIKYACAGGCGTSAIRLPEEVVVGALVITNALGNVYDNSTGATVAGSRSDRGGFVEFEEGVSDYLKGYTKERNTTVGVVATNLKLTHEQLVKVVQMAHDGLAMSIRPVHMTRDGDTLFAASTGRIKTDAPDARFVDVIGATAAKCVSMAVLNSVKPVREAVLL
jgi:L-aminopeptidase/D-esterase-like protein